MWSIDAFLYFYYFTFSLVFFSHLDFLPLLSLSMFSLLYSFLLLAFSSLPLLLFMDTPFYTVCQCGIYPFCPLTVSGFLAFCGHLSRTTHSLAGCPTITSAQSVLVALLSISKQNYLSCFLPLSVFVSPQWIRIKLSHHLPQCHASSGPNPHLPLLGEMSS